MRMNLQKTAAVKEMMKSVADDGGEGVVLQQHGSLYVPGRSQCILKFKITIEDKEGLVVKVTDDSVSLKLPSGRVFKVLIQNVMVPGLVVGDIVTFSSEIIYKHTPVRAIILRKRLDLTWKDVVQSTSGKMEAHTFGSSPSFSSNKMRVYLERYATKRKLDPADSKTWYMLQEDVMSTKHGVTLSKLYGNYPRAIQLLFPEVRFDNEAFDRLYTTDDSSRKVFEDFAKSRGFNPAVAENWYAQSRPDLVSSKVIDNIVVRSFGNNMPRALISLFPDLELDVTKLFEKTRCWSDPLIQRKQFENFALSNGFDPLCSEAWYSQKKLRHYPGIRAIMRYYNNNLIKALTTLFPNIGLKPTLFNGWRKWQDPNMRRQFFLDYAAKVGIDPLQASSWYSQNLIDIRNCPGGYGVVCFHSKSVAKALIDLFPEVPFSERKIFTKHHRRIQME